MAEPSTRHTAQTRPANPLQMGHGPGRHFAPKERPKQSGPTLRRIWGYLSRQKRDLWIVLFSTAISSALALVGPYLIGKSVDDYIIPRNSHGLIQMCLLLLGVYIAGALVSWIQQYVMAGISQYTVQAMRQDLFARMQSLPLRYFDKRTHGELMSRTTNDISNVSNSLNQTVTQLISSVFMLVGSAIMMVSLSPWMTLVTITTIPLVTFATRKVTSYTRRYFTGQQQRLGEVNGFVEEMISGQRVVTAFRREQQVTEDFRKINNQLRKVGIKAQSLSGSMGPLMNAMGNLNFAIVAVAGGWMAFDHIITIGIIVSFLNYSRQFSQPINQLANQYNMVQSAVAGAERVFEVLDEASEYDNGAVTEHSANRLTRIEGEVEFHHVSFGYDPENPILKGVSFFAKPGDTVALVGPTGAGKTTVVNLLTRFYDIDDGAITIDGIDVRKLDKNWLRKQLSIVLQDAYLFSDTIRENIRYGCLEATEEEIVAAAKLANADSFIKKLPNGYDTLLTAEGSNLSQGQRQLLTIARAILANPAILILDEATSSVDTRTELHIQEAMRVLMKGRTSFVIAHRLSTIRDADMILVIDGGQIIECGTHDELLERRGFYSSLYQTQFSRVADSVG